MTDKTLMNRAVLCCYFILAMTVETLMNLPLFYANISPLVTDKTLMNRALLCCYFILAMTVETRMNLALFGANISHLAPSL